MTREERKQAIKEFTEWFGSMYPHEQPITEEDINCHLRMMYPETKEIREKKEWVTEGAITEDFAKDILKIPLGTTVQIAELERQELIYKEYVKQGRKEEYDIKIGRLQVIRENT